MEERDNTTPQGYGSSYEGMPDMSSHGVTAPVGNVQQTPNYDYSQQTVSEPPKQTQNIISSAPVNEVQQAPNYDYSQQTVSEPPKQTQNIISSAPVNDVQQAPQYGYSQQTVSEPVNSVNNQNDLSGQQPTVRLDETAQAAAAESSPQPSAVNTQSNASQQTGNVRKPVYDKFMYEPIGFAGYDNRAHIPPENPYGTITEMYNSGEDEEPEISDEKTALKLVAVLIACCLVISVIGIVYDVANSKKAMSKFRSSGNVVLYSENKPESASDAENFKDENGRYTTEGVAELVRPSIVEIYTYGDPAHKDLIGTGSGVVISKDGYIVTNAHVLESDGYHTIKTIDDESYSATVVGRDVKTDIAVVKVGANKLTPAVLGNSDEAVVGEQVVAIGNPANLSSTVTDGIISAINRKIRSDSTGFQMDCIQTNADISPGNSGGALVNMYGQVIGITSSKYVSSSFEGLGFAITINEAKPIIEELINNGFIGGRFRIGITLIDMSTASKRTTIEEAIGTELPDNFKGVYISSISEDSDIAKTKLKKGDFIIEIDGTPISTYDELYDAISNKYGAGDTVPAKCAHLDKDGISYYEISFKLMEDTSGNY